MTAPRRLLVPSVCVALTLPVLIGLGLWQLQRRAWKHRLLADIAAAEAGPAVPLAGIPPPYRKVQVEGRWRSGPSGRYGAEVRDVGGRSVLGAQVLAVLEPDSGSPIVAMIGWQPDGVAVVLPAGRAWVEGYLRVAERPGWFAASDSPAAGRFYTLDPARIGPALGVAGPAPFVLVALGATVPGVYPVPAPALPHPPDDHLQYAITWFGLAAALVVVFAVYARKVLRP